MRTVFAERQVTLADGQSLGDAQAQRDRCLSGWLANLGDRYRRAAGIARVPRAQCSSCPPSGLHNRAGSPARWLADMDERGQGDATR